MRLLSKSKLMAYRQCPRRLWLEVHRPDLKADSESTQASYATGTMVGEVARRLYDPEGQGTLIDLDELGFPGVYNATAQALADGGPVFEGSFCTKDALALADILLPHKSGRSKAWRMVEVKSSTSVKDIYLDDVAVQAHIVRSAGLKLSGAALAHIDSDWVYPGDGDYQGLLKEVDLTEAVLSRGEEVQGWIDDAQRVVARKREPEASTGAHCNSPYECGFYDYCSSAEPQAELPIEWLPRFHAGPWREQGILDMRELPDDALNDVQHRVRNCTLNDALYFDRQGAADDLKPHKLPAYFMDFETIQFAVPIWAGTRPYQQIPFQYSVHRLDAKGKLEHEEFLDLSGNDPSRAFAEQIIKDCGTKGPVFVYHAPFEKSRLKELGQRFPDLAEGLEKISGRVVDLLPIARNRYYHPSQKGSWSIKAVLPAAAPELSYQALDGVQNGGDAQEAFLEAIHAETSHEQKETLHRQLVAYCELDTYAMVKLWQIFSNVGEVSL